MSILLTVSAADLDDEPLQELTRRLCQDLRDEAGVDSSLAKELAGFGTKGDIVTFGQILIAAIGAHGPVVELINVLRAYAQRKPSLQIKVQKMNGDTLEIKADDLRSDDMTKLVKTIKEAFEEA